MDTSEKTNEKLWFKRKRYGWGWTPVSWEGWLSTLVILLVVVLSAMDITAEPESVARPLIRIVSAVVLLILICYKKGETPRWQWGAKDEGNE